MPALTGAFGIGYLNRASGKPITVTTAASGYAGSGLNTPSLFAETWRSTNGSLTGQNLDADLGGTHDIDVIALLGVNFQDTATRSPVISPNSNYSSPVYNPGSGNCFDATTYPALVNDAPRSGRNMIILPGTTYTSHYIRVTVNDSGNPDNRQKASVFWAGPLLQFADGYSLESEAFKIRLVPVGEPGMERFVRAIDVEWVSLTESEARKLESVINTKMRSGRLLVIPRPTLPATFLSEAIYCTIPDPPARGAVPVADGLRWKTSVTFQEVED